MIPKDAARPMDKDQAVDRSAHVTASKGMTNPLTKFFVELISCSSAHRLVGESSSNVLSKEIVVLLCVFLSPINRSKEVQ